MKAIKLYFIVLFISISNLSVMATTVTVKLLNSEGAGLSGGTVKYYRSGWQTVGTTDENGKIEFDLSGNDYTFGVQYEGIWTQKNQKISDNPVIVFNTKKIKVKLLSAKGEPLEGGLVKYYASGWKDIGKTNSDGEVSKELLPNQITFGVSYAGLWAQKSQNIKSNSEVVFNTIGVEVFFSDSKNNPIPDALVKYYGGGWKSMGNTDTEGKVHYELLPNNITFGISYGGLWSQKNVDLRKTNKVNFKTTKISISLLSSDGKGLEGAPVYYYGGGWKQIGETNSDGKAETELLENNVTFGVRYKGLWTQKNQDIRKDVEIVFHTKKITVTFKDSKGNPLQGGNAKYYGSGWKNIGETDAAGNVSMELLPGNITFGLRYDGAWNQKRVNTNSTQSVDFETIETIVKLIGGGGGIEGATAKYYASGWKTIGLTDSDGKISKEILSGRYSFYLEYQSENFRKNQDIGKDNIVIFYTTSEADLQLSLTADNSNPKDKEEITLTYSLSNNGPSSASGVKVSASIPAGLTFVSAETNKGEFDKDAKIWKVNQVEVNSTVELALKLKANYTELNSNKIDFAEATDYNLFLFGDLEQPSSQTEGKLAAGGDVVLSEYTVGAGLDLKKPEDVLIVGNNLTYNSGSIHNGNVVYGLSSNLPQILVGIPDGTFRQDEVIDFSAAEAHIKTIADNLAQLKSNVDSVMFLYGKLTLEGNNPLTNIFRVDADTFNSANDYEIYAPSGATVIIIVPGNKINFGGGFNVYGTSPNNVLFVFDEADSVKIEGISAYGSILAPYADVNFVSGSLYGQMIAKSLTGEGHMANELFVGYVPPETDLTVASEVIASDQDDPDSHPNNGENNEDDFSKLNISIQIDNSPNNGDNPDVNWEQIAQFSSNEIVWCMSYDNNYKPLAGTWGGKIYRYDGSQWNLINDGMNASYIWDLENNRNTLYAATEKGIFSSADNGESWNKFGLNDFDVRSVDFDSDNNLFAGVWGKGVFKYNSSNNTWIDLSSGLGNLSVHALLVDSEDNLFAGTFGGGIYKSADGGTTWTELNIGYKFIWSLAEDPENSNIIYAGTYGGGVYASISNGGTWSRSNTGLPSRYVYSMAVDSDGNIFISTWMGGVYYSDNSAASWTNLGLIGFGASSIALIPSPPLSQAFGGDNSALTGSSLIIGTGSGAVYSTGFISGAKNENPIVADKFKLMQNYPNPFNPSTKIKYSIPNSENNSQKVNLIVFDILGREIVKLVDAVQSSGEYEVEFSADNLPSGVYFYRLNYGGRSIVKKMVLLR